MKNHASLNIDFSEFLSDLETYCDENSILVSLERPTVLGVTNSYVPMFGDSHPFQHVEGIFPNLVSLFDGTNIDPVVLAKWEFISADFDPFCTTEYDSIIFPTVHNTSQNKILLFKPNDDAVLFNYKVPVGVEATTGLYYLHECTLLEEVVINGPTLIKKGVPWSINSTWSATPDEYVQIACHADSSYFTE
jgi:hypothetical protein